MAAKSSKTGEKTYEIEIVADLERQRLDKALTGLLAARLPGLSRVRLQSLIAEGKVSLGGKTISDASRNAKAGEVYKISVPPAAPARPEAQKIKLEIVYEDKDLLVINKPVGMVVHPAPGNRDSTLVNALLAHCGKSLSGIGGVARPGIVHRLDKDTSGLIVVAKNDLAHKKLTEQFADRSLSRTYEAVVWGVPVPGNGSIRGNIGRHARDRKKMAVTPKGREALTHYRVLEVFSLSDKSIPPPVRGRSGGGCKNLDPSPAKTKGLLRKPKFLLPLPQGERNVTSLDACASSPQGQRNVASLIECKLSTGRTHQIRVHLAHKKHPVIGDPVYGKHAVSGHAPVLKALQAFPRQALHAKDLRFIHPRSGEEMRFSAPLPKDMRDLLKKLRA